MRTPTHDRQLVAEREIPQGGVTGPADTVEHAVLHPPSTPSHRVSQDRCELREAADPVLFDDDVRAKAGRAAPQRQPEPRPIR